MVNIVSVLFAIVCTVSCLSASHAGGVHTFAIRFPGPQSASILQSDVIYPRTQFALPAPQRLTAFRPRRLQPNRRVKPTKIIVGAPLPKLPKDIVTPLTQLVPPLVERLNVFKRQKKVIVGGFLQPGGLASLKPSINNILTPLTQLVPPLVERLNVFKKTKKNVIVGLLPSGLAAKPPLSSVLAQLTPAVKKPVIVGGRIIGYSDRSQNW